MGQSQNANADRLSPGLYVLLQDSELATELMELPSGSAAVDTVDPVDTPHVLKRYLSDRILHHSESTPAGSRVDEANRILAALSDGLREPACTSEGPR